MGILEVNWLSTGYYGQENFGDDVFCLVQGVLYDQLGINYGLLNSQVKSNVELRQINYYLINKFINYPGKIGTLSRVAANILGTCTAKNLVFGGGSVFGKYASYRQRVLASKIAANLGTKLHAFGVSIGPFASLEQLEHYSEILKEFSSLYVRDQASMDYAKEMGINAKLVPDMAWVLPELLPIRSNRDGKLILAFHLDLDFRLFATQIDFFNTFSEIVILNLDKHLFNTSQNLFNYIANMASIPVRIINYTDVPLEYAIETIASSNYVITSKLHGAIVSAAYGTRFALFEYQVKCSEFVATMNDNNILNHGNWQSFVDSVEETYNTPHLYRESIKEYSNRVFSSFSEMVSLG